MKIENGKGTHTAKSHKTISKQNNEQQIHQPNLSTNTCVDCRSSNLIKSKYQHFSRSILRFR